MYEVKETSTNNLNVTGALSQCPVTFTLHKIGGRWKPLILYHLSTGPKRYSELKKCLPAITEKMLIQHLKELELDNLVSRKAMPVIPPHVTYSLTEMGKGLKPVMDAMAKWGLQYNQVEREC
jgi:DNA-binding HxlR family transcriptional regulator